jgi:hypothetical protein
MPTFQQLVDNLQSLNDSGANGNPKRWPDSERLVYAIEGLEKLRRERPDAFIGLYSLDLQLISLSSNFPIASEFVNAVKEYVIARCLMKNNDVGAEGSLSTAHFNLARSDIA